MVADGAMGDGGNSQGSQEEWQHQEHRRALGRGRSRRFYEEARSRTGGKRVVTLSSGTKRTRERDNKCRQGKRRRREQDLLLCSTSSPRPYCSRRTKQWKRIQNWRCRRWQAPTAASVTGDAVGLGWLLVVLSTHQVSECKGKGVHDLVSLHCYLPSSPVLIV